MAFSRRKGTGSDSTKRSRLGRGAPRDPFAHLSEERAKAEEGEPWFLASDDDNSELDVQAGISSNLKPEDLALLQEDVAYEPLTPGEVRQQDPLADPSPVTEPDSYGTPEVSPETEFDTNTFPDPEAGPGPGSTFDGPDMNSAAREMPPFEPGPSIDDVRPPEPTANITPDYEPNAGNLVSEPDRRAYGELGASDTLAHPVADTTSLFDRPDVGDTYVEPETANAFTSESVPSVFGDQETSTSDVLEDLGLRGTDVEGAFADIPDQPEIPLTPIEPGLAEGTVLDTLDVDVVDEALPAADAASVVIDVEAREEEATGGDGSGEPEDATPPEEPLRSALLQSFRDVVAKAPANPELDDEENDPREYGPPAEDATSEKAESREIRPRKPPARPRRF